MRRAGRESSRSIFLLLLISICGWIAISNRHVVERSGAAFETTDWLFLRDGVLHPSSGEGIEIIVTGDIMPGREPLSGGDPFRLISREIAAADLAIGNLEGVITPGEIRESCLRWSNHPPEFRLLLPQDTASQLMRGGFDILGVANNHALDCGEIGVKETVENLQRAGLRPVGAWTTPDGAYHPIYLTLEGLRIAFLAFNSINHPDTSLIDEFGSGRWQPQSWQLSEALQAVHLAREKADFVIVSIHWGEEYNLQAGLWQRETAGELVSAGADLIFGHHPHAVQETQVFLHLDPGIPPAFVAYSLGNFMFDQYDPQTSQGLALRVFIDKQGLNAVQALPLRTTRQPRWMDQKESQEMINRIRPEPSRSAFACDDNSCSPASTFSEAEDGLFSHGSIDLTGDGQEEEIWLDNGRIYIYRENELVWQSPEMWKVIDLALGDPNDDGRFEILAAVNGKKDGISTSQPFILGYRSGLFRQLWGGSPVSDPIREVELGDLDADGKQELVVIEEHGMGNQAVAVWKWHGWGFSLFWRSLDDRYTDLLVQVLGDGEEVINVGLSW